MDCPWDETCEVSAVELALPDPLTIACVYVPPASTLSSSQNNLLLAKFELLFQTFDCVLGDFNGAMPGYDVWQDPNNRGLVLDHLFASDPVLPPPVVFEAPTRVAGSYRSAPDLAWFCSRLANKHQTRILPLSSSDHVPILHDIRSGRMRKEPYRRPAKWAHSKANWQRYRQLIEKDIEGSCIPLLADCQLHLSPSSLESVVNAFHRIVYQAACHSIPRGCGKRRCKAWWHEGLDVLSSHMHDLHLTLASASGIEAESLANELSSCKASFRQAVMDAKRCAWEHACEMLDSGSCRPTWPYQLLHSMEQGSSARPSAALQQASGKWCFSTADRARAHLKYFAGVSTATPTITRAARSDHRSFNQMFCSPSIDDSVQVSMRELEVSINALTLGTSAGHDQLTPELIRELPDIAKEVLLRICNLSLSIGHIPAHWRKAIVIPLLKPDRNPHQLASYRPISLLCVTAKVMERVLHNKFAPSLALCDHQFGFRAGRCSVVA